MYAHMEERSIILKTSTLTNSGDKNRMAATDITVMRFGVRIFCLDPCTVAYVSEG